MSLAVKHGPADLDHLESLVRGQLSGRIRDLRIVPRGEGLILLGRAQTYYAKQLAQAAVMSATCFPILANEIEVH